MLKLYMNEPYAHHHEFSQAKRLVQLLEAYASNQPVWLCLNFNLGGKAIDAALIFKDCFIILELKAVSGVVDCGKSLENSAWTWSADPLSESHKIQTLPYANPFSQIKSYRTAVIGEFEQRQKGFLGNITLLKAPFNFAYWVKGCVLMSTQSAEDVKVVAGQISHGTSKWFCYGTLGDVSRVVEGLSRTGSLAEKEIERLIDNVIGLKRVDSVIEVFNPELIHEDGDEDVPLQRKELPTETALSAFMRRYGDASVIKPPKTIKISAKLTDNSVRSVNDFSEIDALFLNRETEVAQVCSKPMDRNIKSAERSMSREYLKMTLKCEMEAEVPNYGTMTELEGEDAVALVVRDFPQLSNFEVSKVLRFGDFLSDVDGERMVRYFNEKYRQGAQWSKLAFAQGGIDFVFGKVLDISSLTQQYIQEEITYERPISTRFMLPRWMQEFIEKESEGLPPLSVREVQYTGNLSEDDVRRYAMTYFPRSCAEAFVVSDWLMGNNKTLPKVSILDVGCGCGGSALGCLLTLHKHYHSGKSEIAVTGVDVNAHALEFAKNIFNYAQLQFREHRFNFLPRCGDLIDVLPQQGLFDIVIASKSIGELALAQGHEEYAKAVRLCSKRVNDHGVLILIDLVKHRLSLENAVDVLANEGFEGWLKTLSVFIEGVADEEEYVCACLTRGSSKEIRKE